jgi:hypothetical protein
VLTGAKNKVITQFFGEFTRAQLGCDLHQGAASVIVKVNFSGSSHEDYTFEQSQLQSAIDAFAPSFQRHQFRKQSKNHSNSTKLTIAE